jgi:hypothetical protein
MTLWMTIKVKLFKRFYVCPDFTTQGSVLINLNCILITFKLHLMRIQLKLFKRFHLSPDIVLTIARRSGGSRNHPIEVRSGKDSRHFDLSEGEGHKSSEG